MLFTFRILSSKTASVISAQIGVSVSEENLDDDYQWYDFRDTKGRKINEKGKGAPLPIIL